MLQMIERSVLFDSRRQCLEAIKYILQCMSYLQTVLENCMLFEGEFTLRGITADHGVSLRPSIEAQIEASLFHTSFRSFISSLIAARLVSVYIRDLEGVGGRS